MELFATAARGTEVALRDELRSLRFRGVRADRGGVHFSGDLVEAGRACLESAVAVRVLCKLGEHDARNEQALYDGVRALEFAEHLTPKHTLAVSSVARDSALTHTQYIAQKTKDAIVDAQRDRTGARSSVDLESPDLRVFVHLVRDKATVYLDVSGESLHRRGWRARIGGAPLKETLAAALVRMSGWDRVRPFVDPMCGSGTLAIEADLWARDVAPNIHRKRFGFERWASYDGDASRRMKELRDEARDRVSREGPDVYGSDHDPHVVDLAQQNAGAAGSRARFEVLPITGFSAAPGSQILTNPPYGERLESDEKLYREMCEVLRAQHGCDVGILSGTPEIERAMRIRPLRSVPVWNGPIECRLLSYSIS
jgi:putative N6-adenine-specific DNA methylase